MEILQHIWGSTPEGEGIILYTMRNSRGSEVQLCNVGAAIVGVKFADREGNIITSLELDPYAQEQFNYKIFEKYARCEQEDVRFEEYMCDDADYLIVAFGSSARICKETIAIARANGHKVGLIRPITLWPFPSKKIAEVAKRTKGVLVAELNMGQMVEDVRLAVNGAVPVEHYGRTGGAVYTPDQVYEALLNKIIKK